MGVMCVYSLDVQPKPNESAVDCFAAVREEMAAWLRGVFRQQQGVVPQLSFAGERETPLPNQRVWSRQQHGATHSLATLTWEFPNLSEAVPSTWRVHCAVARAANAVQVELTTEVLFPSRVLRPVRSRSPVLRTLVMVLARLRSCSVAGQPLPGTVPMFSESEVEGFVHGSVLDSRRVLPLVVMACDDHWTPKDLENIPAIPGHGIRARPELPIVMAS